MTQLSLVMEKDYRKSSLVLWAIFFVGIMLFVGLNQADRSVLHHYVGAAQAWTHGENLYLTNGRGFLYFPQCAILFIPLSFLPKLFGELLWRGLSILFYAYAIFSWLNLNKTKISFKFFIISLLAMPIAFSSCRNGQMNLVLAGIMMLSTVFVSQEKWWLTAFIAVLGFALKPTMIVLLLLLIALYKPLWWRVLCVLLAFFAFPFLMQAPDYVLAQYKGCYAMLQAASAMGSNENTWAQAFGIFGLLGHPLSSSLQNSIRVLMAGFTLLLCINAKQKMSRADFSLFLFSIAATYLMLFNPRTENNDYAIIAPAMGLFFFNHLVHKKYVLSIMSFMVMFGVMFSHPIGTLLVGEGTWLAPMMTIVFFFMMITILYKSASNQRL